MHLRSPCYWNSFLENHSKNVNQNVNQNAYQNTNQSDARNVKTVITSLTGMWPVRPVCFTVALAAGLTHCGAHKQFFLGAPLFPMPYNRQLVNMSDLRLERRSRFAKARFGKVRPALFLRCTPRDSHLTHEKPYIFLQQSTSSSLTSAYTKTTEYNGRNGSTT